MNEEGSEAAAATAILGFRFCPSCGHNLSNTPVDDNHRRLWVLDLQARTGVPAEADVKMLGTRGQRQLTRANRSA